MVAALTDTQIQGLHETKQRYRSKLMGRAKQRKEEAGYTTDAGDEIRGQDGDCRVSDGNDRWTVTADECNRPFAHVDGDYFLKEGTVLAVNIDDASAENRIEDRNGRW